jgi:small conductance mechanosensitive channel
LNAGLSAVIALIALGLVAALRRLARVGARHIPGAGEARGVHVKRATGVFNGVVTLAAALAAGLVIARVWGLDVLAWVASGVGEEAVKTALRLGVLLVVGVVAMEVAGVVISHGVGRLARGARAPRRRGQLRTLAPLLKGLVQTAIVLTVTLTALGELGVKIGPLLAGAGVVGIAVGFGAQTLVKDFITGVFLIVEDIVSVGDTVRIGEFRGQVEQMTLRTIRLRDFDGTLHVFPYSEAQVVHNQTKAFSYYPLNLVISYDSDLDEALALLHQVSEAMQAEEAFADKILEPIEVAGVDALGDQGVVLKARIKTPPGRQWLVGREFNRRIKLAFDKAHIEISTTLAKPLKPPEPPPAGAAPQRSNENITQGSAGREGPSDS